MRLSLLKPNLNLWEHLMVVVFMNRLWPVHINMMSGLAAFAVWCVATGWFIRRVVSGVLNSEWPDG